MADMQLIGTLAASAVPSGGAHDLAVAICLGRGQEPFERILFAGFWMDRWQAVVAESLMLDAIRAEVL